MAEASYPWKMAWITGASGSGTGSGTATPTFSVASGSTGSTAKGTAKIKVNGKAEVVATSADPTVGLVFYDLKSCLRDAAEKPAPKRGKKKSDGA